MSNKTRTKSRTKQDWIEPWIYKGVPAGDAPDITKEWTLFYRYRKPGTNTFPRFKGKSGDMNRYHTLEEREEAAEMARIALLELLQEGKVNPFASDEEKGFMVPKTAVEALKEALRELLETEVIKPVKVKYKSHHKIFTEKLVAIGYGAVMADNIRFRHVKKVIDKIQEEKNYTNNTYNGFLSTVNKLFKEFIKSDIRLDNPAALIQYKPIQKDTGYHKRFDPKEEPVIDKHLSIKKPGLRLFWILLKYTGRRRSEICRMKIKNILIDRNTIYMGKTKSGRPDIAMIPAQLKEEIIKSGIMECDREYYVFGKFTDLKPGTRAVTPGYITDMWKMYVKNPVEKGGLGINKNLYGNKHTIATNLIKAGADPNLVRLLLGHVDQETTAIYGQGAKEQAFEKLQPYFNKIINEGL